MVVGFIWVCILIWFGLFILTIVVLIAGFFGGVACYLFCCTLLVFIVVYLSDFVVDANLFGLFVVAIVCANMFGLLIEDSVF